MKKQAINYDKKSDILYFFIRPCMEERFEDISENITIEYDAKDRPIGIEIFNASRILGAKLNPKKDFSTPILHKIR